MRHRRRQVVELGVHLTRDHIIERRARAAIRHVHHVGLGQGLEEFAVQVADAARAGRGIGVLARVRLQQGDELGQVLGRHRRVYRQHVRHVHQVGDGHEILERVVGVLGVGRRVGGHGADGGYAQGVTVRGGARDGVRADGPTAAAPVFHHNGLPELAAQAFGHDAGNDVGGAAGGKRNNQADGFVGVGVGGLGRGTKADACDGGGQNGLGM
ncbi:hypothetical protein D3C72_1431830 [compost metagenome]